MYIKQIKHAHVIKSIKSNIEYIRNVFRIEIRGTKRYCGSALVMLPLNTFSALI